MKNTILIMITGFVFLFCISISFIFQPGIVLASNAQGSQDTDLSDFKKQLESMEETIKKQQEMINALKDKIETKEKVVAKPTPSYREENEIERIVDDYLMKDETRKKMVKAGLTPEYFSWKNGLRFETGDGKFKFKLGGRIMNDWGWFSENSAIKRVIGDQVDGTEFRRARLYIAGEIYNNIGFKAQYDFAGGDVDFKDVYLELKKIPVLEILRWAISKNPSALKS